MSKFLKLAAILTPFVTGARLELRRVLKGDTEKTHGVSTLGSMGGGLAIPLIFCLILFLGCMGCCVCYGRMKRKYHEKMDR